MTTTPFTITSSPAMQAKEAADEREHLNTTAAADSWLIDDSGGPRWQDVEHAENLLAQHGELDVLKTLQGLDKQNDARGREVARLRAASPWPTVAALAAWLDESNGTGPHETSMRLMKLTEEVGEVTQAYIGLQGQNPRKGVTHTEADVADELCDVIVTAMVALHSFTDDPAGHFAGKLQKIAARVGATQ